jgi:hypothetical protein
MTRKETGLAGGSLQARSDDQLSGSISSENTAAVVPTQAQLQLISRIKAHIAAGDKATQKANDHYISAGQHLATLKREHAGSWAEWEALLKSKVGVSTGRASELMQIADGRKTLAELRADKNETSKIAHAKERSSLNRKKTPRRATRSTGGRRSERTGGRRSGRTFRPSARMRNASANANLRRW